MDVKKFIQKISVYRPYLKLKKGSHLPTKTIIVGKTNLTSKLNFFSRTLKKCVNHMEYREEDTSN